MLKAELPNLFDQYTQGENRVTNALLQTLAASPRLARSFLKEFIGITLDPRRDQIVLTAQKKPGQLGDRGRGGSFEAERQTVPDGWLVCEARDLAVVIEAKVQPGALRLDQLGGHLREARGYRRRHLLVLTPDEARPAPVRTLARLGRRLQWHPWVDVHQWAASEVRSTEGRQAAGHLLRSLKGFLEMNERLSGFQGIDFRDGYDVRKAKGILMALMRAIERQVESRYPGLRLRRSGITTSEGGVWDFFGVTPQFTSDLHFTVGISEMQTEISLTIPNAAGTRWKRLREIISDEAQTDKLERIVRRLRQAAPELWIRLDHRHFIGRRRPIRDAFLEFKVDTAGLASRSGSVRPFPLWLKTAWDAVLAKKRINLQLQFGVYFRHDQTKEVQNPQFAGTALRIIRSFGPLYRYLRV